MSNVTNIMLSMGILEDDVQLINTSPSSLNLRADGMRPGYEFDGHFYLSPISDSCMGGAWGGSKFPECTVWAGAFDWLPLEEYKKLVAQTPWKNPYEVQLFVMDNDSQIFDVLGWRELAAYR